jgi:nucleotide-binding universal stress UspA family protein
MSYASFLVHVEAGSTSSDVRLDLAASLARRFGAVLIGIAAEAVRPPPVDAFGGAVLIGEVIVAEEEQIRSELEAAEQNFRYHPGAQGLTTEWRSRVDLPVKALTRESRSADLVIVGRDLERLRAGPYRSADPGEVIMAVGRPVLVVPPAVESLSGRASRASFQATRTWLRRATWDALPFLRAADSVRVVEITEDNEAARRRVGDVVRHLERHRVKAQGEVRTQHEASAADEIILVAEQDGADLIVAGGYGHARLREWVFGGVTRDLLRHCPKCCLLSH